MNRALGVLSALFLSACTVDSDVVQVGDFLVQSATGRKEKISRERAANVPYATMGLEIGLSAQALLVLGTIAQDELDWFGGEEVFVRTRRGHVIRTVGLPYDLGGLRPQTAGPADAARENSTSQTLSLDYPDLGVFGAAAQCSSRTLGDDMVQIFGATILTRHIVEHCEVPALRWRFDNDYWADRMSGYIWRSSQHIHPKSPPLILEVFRPEQVAPG